VQRGPGRRLGGAKVSMRSVFVHVWVDAPLTTRVTLNMKDFGGREVGLSAKSFEVQHVLSTQTHRLSAKGSRDSSLHVEITRAWRFCGCVRGRATPGPSNARDNAFGWASGWFIYINMLISIKILIMKIIMKLNKQMSFLYIIYIYDYVRGRATPGPYSARDGAFGWASGMARPRVARAI